MASIIEWWRRRNDSENLATYRYNLRMIEVSNTCLKQYRHDIAFNDVITENKYMTRVTYENAVLFDRMSKRAQAVILAERLAKE